MYTSPAVEEPGPPSPIHRDEVSSFPFAVGGPLCRTPGEECDIAGSLASERPPIHLPGLVEVISGKIRVRPARDESRNDPRRRPAIVDRNEDVFVLNGLGFPAAGPIAGGITGGADGMYADESSRAYKSMPISGNVIADD